MYDFNGFNPADNNGKYFDPLLVSWELFESTGHPAYYMLYRDLFDYESALREQEKKRKE